MESEGGDEKRQRVLALSSALQVEFEVGRFRYLPRVKFQLAARINLHSLYGLLVLTVFHDVIGKEASANFDFFCSLKFTCFLLSRLDYTPTTLCRLLVAWLDFF